MPVFFGSGNIITRAKTVRTSSFIFTKISEIEIEYQNLFKGYSIDSTDGFTESQNVFYDPFKYSDYLDTVTSVSFGTKEVYSGEMYNTFFDVPEFNLQYITGTAFNSTDKETGSIQTRYTSEIYQSLDILTKGGVRYEEVAQKLQQNIVEYSNLTMETLDYRKDYVINNYNLIYDNLKNYFTRADGPNKILETTDYITDPMASKQILDAMYFTTKTGDFEGALNPLDGTLNLNKVTILLIQSHLEDFSLNRSSLILDLDEKNITKDLERSVFEESVPILQNPESGLYYLEFNDTIEKIDDSMFFDNDIDRVYESQNLVYGSPRIEYHPINNFFQRYIPQQAPTGEYNEVVSDFIVETQFYTQEKNDITIDLSPKYISDSDKTFIRSIFYIELDDYQDYLGYVPYVKTSTDTAYIPDEQFIQTKVHVPDKNIFKFKFEEIKYGGKYVISPTNYFLGIKFGGKYIISQEGDVFVFYNTTEARYAGYHKDYDTIYEYINDLFLSTNLSSHDSIKPHDTLYYRPESNHPTTGGSHLGHFVPHVAKLGDGTRFMDSEYFKVASLFAPSEDFKVTQIVKGRDAQYGKLFEFDPVYHDMDAGSNEMIGTGFNFVYEIDKGRLPNCLTINNSIISGNTGETEQFLNQYSYESWIQDQNLQIDLNYEDMNPERVKEIVVTVIGRATTSGTVDLLVPENTESEFEIGDIIEQKNSNGDVTGTATIVSIDGSVLRDFSLLGAVPQNINIVRHTLGMIDGSFNSSEYNIVSALNDNGESLTRYIVSGIEYVSIKGTSKELSILDSELTTTNGLVKEVQLVFPINNNYTYDKDRFLLNTDGISDREDRFEWLTYMRDQGHYRFDVDKNISEIQEIIDQLKIDYNSGLSNLTPQEFESELEFLELSKGTPTEERTYERLEEIDEFTINCEDTVDEKTFYRGNIERIKRRGYPIYASCN
tara:strand:+ start:557 stop:3388 length:2832 start_codon:yes stop_codon:yes gene_type:complete